jgi:Tol biopolymer transport system component
MTPQDITRIQFVSDPQISPDARQVAFVVTTLSEEKDEYLANIWMVDANTGGPQRFTAGPKRDTAPRWSPDGTWLAFVSEREAKKKPQLFVMRADGGEPTRLTDLKNGVANPVWSPDGSRLAFISRVGGWQEPEDEDEKQKSKPAGVISTLKHKLNGEGFTYDRRPHVFVVPAEGGEPRQITDGDYEDEDPAWSPDGRWIAFTSARHENRDDDNIADVWVVSPEGGEPRRVTDSAGPVALPAFSPDGTTIAYLGHRHPKEAGRNERLFTVPLEGGAPRCLTSDLDRTCFPVFATAAPIWSADGEWIFFSVEDRGNIPVYRVRAGGGGPPEPLITGDRQITGLSVSPGRQGRSPTPGSHRT